MSSSVLVVSEAPGDPHVYERQIGEAWRIDAVCVPSEASSALSDRPVDVILLDSDSEAAEDEAFIGTLRQLAPTAIPVVFGRDDSSALQVKSRVTRQSNSESVRYEEPFRDQIARECLVVRLYEDECTRRIQPEITRVPTQRGIYYQVVEEVNSPHGSLERVAEVIANEPVLTARVLQMVNSAALGLRRRFVDAHEAVLMLGGERIKSLIVFVEVFSICEKFRFIKFSPEKLWQHSLTVGRVARELMRSRSSSMAHADASFTGGLLHDVGKLFLAINLPDRYRAVLDDVEEDPLGDVWAAEVKRLQTSHAEVGAIVLESWNLPLSILEAVGYHHSPNRLSAEHFGPLEAVAVADVLVNEKQGQRQSTETRLTPLSQQIWDLWGDDQMSTWLEELIELN